MPRDIVDVVTEKMGLQCKETVFWRACIDAGFRDRAAEDEAHKWFTLYCRKVNGIEYMPRWLRDFLRMKAGETTPLFSETHI